MDYVFFFFFEDAIKLLVEAQIPVIMAVGYFAEEPWGEIFDPKDQDLYNKRICPLIEKINELKLSGITLSVTDLYVSIQFHYKKNVE